MKNSWLSQIAKAKDRPNLVRWREELLPTTKDSSEDFEDATLSVELMKARCDVCYHEKAVRVKTHVAAINNAMLHQVWFLSFIFFRWFSLRHFYSLARLR